LTLNKNKKFKSNEALATIIDFIFDPAVVIDAAGKIVAANKLYGKCTGYGCLEVVGKNFLEENLIDKENKALLLENLKTRSSESSIRPCEIKIKAKNSKSVSMEIVSKQIKYQGKALALIIFHNRNEKLENQNQLNPNLIENEANIQALQKNEEKFREISNSVKDAVILVDEKSRVTYWNPAAEVMFGYSSSEAIGKFIHKLVVPQKACKEFKERIKSSVKDFAEIGAGYFTIGSVDLIARHKDGGEFPVELSLSPVRLAGKWNAVGIVKDTTQRKQAEHRLREAEQCYHTLFDQAPLGVLVIDPETASFVEFNDVAPIQLGYSREEFEKLAIFDIEAKESEQEVRSHIAQIIKEGSAEFETKHLTKLGAVKNVLVTAKTFKIAGKTFLHCIFHDITEIRKVQNTLMKSEAQYRQLVELAQEGISALDNNLNIVFVNPRLAEILGYTEMEMIGKSAFDFLDKNMIEQAKSFLAQSTQGIKGEFEYEFLRKDKTRVYTNIVASVIKDDQGQPIGTLCLMSDITGRKQAEKALKQSEELSRAIVTNSPVGIATSDPSYHFLSANEAFRRILGYTEDELRKLTFKEITCADDLQESVDKMGALETRRTSFLIQEKRYVKKDGTTMIGRVRVNAIRDPAGNPILFVAELEDITESRRLENELRASEERFRAISTSATDAIILIDEEDQIVYWNPAAEKTFGFAERETIGKKLSALVVPPHGFKTHAALLEELKHNSLSNRCFEFMALRKDRSKFPIDLRVSSVKLKDKNYLLAIARDISDRKAMEEALRQERDMLENVAANIDAGLAIISEDHRILWANQLLKKVAGSNSIENKNCYPIFGRSDKVCRDCGVDKIFETGISVDRHDYCFKESDCDRWIELIVTPVKDKNGKVVAALELAVDITERKQMQDKLADYSQKLEELVQKRTEELKKTQSDLVKSERLAAIGEIAAMVGHDLRNPLTGIKNAAYYLEKKGTGISESQAKEMLKTIDKCVAYSNKIVSDLLNYSREIRLDLQETSLRVILLESLKMIQVPTTVKIENNLLHKKTLKVDSEKIKRVFVNLIKNAIDAMPNGGKITVDSKEAKGNIEISFTDTGTGIKEEDMQKLFLPLFTTKAQGMGFGLAICRRIIEAHGGTIMARSAKDKGTTFTVTLPVEQKSEFEGGEKVWINMPESLSSTMTKASEKP
jgi:PAS domain S-box-containing protein